MNFHEISIRYFWKSVVRKANVQIFLFYFRHLKIARVFFLILVLFKGPLILIPCRRILKWFKTCEYRLEIFVRGKRSEKCTHTNTKKANERPFIQSCSIPSPWDTLNVLDRTKCVKQFFCRLVISHVVMWLTPFSVSALKLFNIKLNWSPTKKFPQPKQRAHKK